MRMKTSIAALAVWALACVAPAAAQLPRLAWKDFYPKGSSKLVRGNFARVITVSPANGDYTTLAAAYTYINTQTHDATHEWLVIVFPDGTTSSPGTKPTFVTLVDHTLAARAFTFSFAAAAGAANIAEVTITAKDQGSTTVAAVHQFGVWLSDSATCAGHTATAASGTVQAKAASGLVVDVQVAKKAVMAQTLATGVFILEITDTAKTGFFVCAQSPSGLAIASSQLVTGSYGE